MIEAVGRLPAREHLRVRLGIATGIAVVGDLIGELSEAGSAPASVARAMAWANRHGGLLARAGC